MAKLKILKTGETDIKSTDIWRFCVHSDYPTQKIYSSGQTTLTIPTNSNSGIKILSHSLGYAPIVMAMFETEGGRFAKVMGESKVSKIIGTIQCFAVNSVLNEIRALANTDIPLTYATSYVQVGDKIRFISSPGNGGVLPSPLNASTDYYVVSIVSSQYFKISTSPGGAPIDILDGGGYYGDLFINVTNPHLDDLNGIYGMQVTASDISFSVNPTLNSPLAANNVDINVYYIILYDEI